MGFSNIHYGLFFSGQPTYILDYELAKAGGKLKQPHSLQSFNEAKTLLKHAIKMKWIKQNDQSIILSINKTEISKPEYSDSEEEIKHRAHLHPIGLRDFIKVEVIMSTAGFKTGFWFPLS